MINLVKRNLEQQVLKNQDDIEALKRLGMPGVKVTAVVNSIEDITEPIVGAFYMVKNEQNTYNLYIYTADEELLDLGEFPKSGPQGLMGLQGPKGETGASTRWYSGISFPLDNVKDGDMFLNTSSYQVYLRSGGQWISQTNIKGAAGRDGSNGNSITSINKQRQVDKTVITINTRDLSPVTFDVPDGTPGTPFHVQHIYPENDEEIPATLPDDATVQQQLTTAFGAASASKVSSAIVYKTLAGSYLYVVIQKKGEWVYDSVGEIESIKGPAGDPGDRIMDTAYITKSPAGAQYPNTYKLYIHSIPYLNQAPVIDYNPPGELCFKVVMLPKSLEASTLRRNGYIYFFYEE